MEGFRLAITSMQVGEKAVFTIPQPMVPTKSGCPTNIPWNISHNQTIRFDIELISLISGIFGEQGVIKKIIKLGTRKKVPLEQDEVLVKYNAFLEDGASLSKSEGIEFSLSEGFFCSAFADVVKTMTAGEEATVVIKPEYGFGEQGRPSTGSETAVPPNATLYVDIQLISWKIVTHIGKNMDIVKRKLWTECMELPQCHSEPNNGDVVNVRLIGKLQDGTVFDRRGHDGYDPFKFTVGKEHVVYGLYEAVMTMVEGEHAFFTIPPKYAFGAVGSNQYPLAVIPPNSVVTYEIELLSFVEVAVMHSGFPGMFKYGHEATETGIFVPPLSRPDQVNAGQVSVGTVTAAATTPATSLITPQASPVGSGSSSSTTANGNQSAGATTTGSGRETKASLLRSCFGLSSNN